MKTAEQAGRETDAASPATSHAPSPSDDVSTRLDALIEEWEEHGYDEIRFRQRQFDLGLAWVHFAPGDGGLGVEPKLQSLVSERIGRAGAPGPRPENLIGLGMGGPTIAAHGTGEQKRRYLRPLFSGEETWCQMFSEPGSGSDVASLSTRAERDGDEWVINGQKVWTTVAHLALRGMLIARTDPAQPKHKGLTYFVIDMEADGVEVRPLYQITGEAEFNEVYFTDVRVPDRNRVGDIGAGWNVALTTLMNERVAIGGSVPPRGGGAIAEAVRLHRASQLATETRDRLMHLWIRAEAVRLTNIRAHQLRALGTPGPEGSIGKLMSTELNQDITNLLVDLLGAEGTLKPGGYPMTRTSPQISAQQAFLRARANSIEGGTSEVMRNILGERILGLPGEPRTDKNFPWTEVPRS